MQTPWVWRKYVHVDTGLLNQTDEKGVSNSVICSKQYLIWDMQQPLNRQLDREIGRQAGREEESQRRK